MSDFKGVLIEDSRLQLTDEISFGVLCGAAQSNYQPYNAVSTSNSNVNFNINLTALSLLHSNRMANNPEYKYLLEDIESVKKAELDNYNSVNETNYKKELTETEAKNKARKEAREKAKASLGKNATNADLILDEAIELITDKMVLDKN